MRIVRVASPTVSSPDDSDETTDWPIANSAGDDPRQGGVAPPVTHPRSTASHPEPLPIAAGSVRFRSDPL